MKMAKKLTIVRHSPDRMTSVYRGRAHLGLIFPVLPSSDSYEARPSAPFCDRLPNVLFTTEADAIEYLAGAGR